MWVSSTYWAWLKADRQAAATAGTRAAPVAGLSPCDSARSVPRVSTIWGHPGTLEENRLAAIVTDAWSVSTQVPAGIRRERAGGMGPMTGFVSVFSVPAWTTVITTSATPASPAAAGASHRPAPAAGTSGWVAASRRAAASATDTARNGARKAEKW